MPDQRITLVTGANKGLGRETARRLSEQGHTVYVGARDPARGRPVAEELGAQFVQIDVTDDTSVDAAASEILQREGRLDVLVNNAGVGGPRSAVADITGGDAVAILDTNVAGTVRMVHAFLPLLERSAAPVIVNVTSGQGSFARKRDPNSAESTVVVPLYSASKAALNMLTVEYARALPGIRINLADPGLTATDLSGGQGTTVTEGSDPIVAMANVGPDGPTGTFVDGDGLVEW